MQKHCQQHFFGSDHNYSLQFDTVCVYLSCMSHSKSFPVSFMSSPLTLNVPTDLISLPAMHELMKYAHMGKVTCIVVNRHKDHAGLQRCCPRSTFTLYMCIWQSSIKALLSYISVQFYVTTQLLKADMDFGVNSQSCALSKRRSPHSVINPAVQLH